MNSRTTSWHQPGTLPYSCLCYFLYLRLATMMMSNIISTTKRFIRSVIIYMRMFVFQILSVGPIPSHIAFIMDGNRRYAIKRKVAENDRYKFGFLSLMSMLKYCNELGVKYVTIYTFAIDNFKRRPEDVESVMHIMQEKIAGLLKEESFVNQYGVRIYFIGNLRLLDEKVRVLAEKAMKATAKNTKFVVLICVAYSSSDDITQAVQKTCTEWSRIRENGSKNVKFDKFMELKNGASASIEPLDVERCMHMRVAPDTDILIRSSGETRLSNFLLWETTNTFLLSPKALWPELGLCHLVWAILVYQRNYAYLHKKKKKQV